MSHIVEIPYLCSQYYRTFSSKEDLAGHMRTHSEEKIHYHKSHILTRTGENHINVVSVIKLSHKIIILQFT